MRVAFVVLVLGLSVVVGAQEDEGLLDTPSHGGGIPERLEALEREWAEDVGTKDPVDEPTDAPDAEDAVEPAPEHEEHETESAKSQPPVEAAPRAKPRSALGNPLPDPLGKRGGEGATTDPAAAAPAERSRPTPSSAEQRATTPEE